MLVWNHYEDIGYIGCGEYDTLRRNTGFDISRTLAVEMKAVKFSKSIEKKVETAKVSAETAVGMNSN